MYYLIIQCLYEVISVKRAEFKTLSFVQIKTFSVSNVRYLYFVEAKYHNNVPEENMGVFDLAI